VDPQRAGRWPHHLRRLARFDEAGTKDHGKLRPYPHLFLYQR
jgi:hypothetical protein